VSVKAMSYFRDLSDDCPDLSYSPLLRAARLTLKYAQDHGAIGLTKTGAFKRVFVHWAAEHFDWPGMSARTGVIRSRIPITSGHSFRFDPVTDSRVSDHPWNRP